MKSESSALPSWRQSRYGLAAFWLVSLLAGWHVLRLILFFSFKPPGLTLMDDLGTFIVGLHRDVFVALLLTLPLLAWLAITPDRRFAARWHRAFFWSACALFWSIEMFLLFVEYFFFEEFRSRFNTVAVDYVLYPKEVFINIWESYHVGWVIAICVCLGLGWVWLARKLFARMWEQPVPLRSRMLRLGIAVALTVALAFTIQLKGARVSHDRTVNEIANNGAIALTAAAWTRHLDYGAFYKTNSLEESYARVRRLLARPGVEFLEPGRSIRRRVAGDPSRPRLNVILLLEESLGSTFWGCLGRPDTLTPEMDRIAAEEGLLFTNLYASGNRTVRGMEGVLSSFPPLPGDSIVKRDLSDNVETLARLLKRDGYSTLFLYGGRGLFDGTRSFAVRNGYDRFLEQKHFADPVFATIWGVCDEDLFDRTIVECRELARSGAPFFVTALTVSNHKPYTYPTGRIPEDPEARRREHAVRFADYALGKFFRDAKKESFWTNTIFVVVADHGDRVYGEQSVPIRSYEIPLVIVGPAVVPAPRRIGQLGGSLDVAPTILGLIGRPYESVFLGCDLLNDPSEAGRALLNHNRDIGLLAGDRMVVLGLFQTVEFYAGNPKQIEMEPLSNPGESDRELELDAIALYQVADDLYVNRRYHVGGEPAALPSETEDPPVADQARATR